MRGGPSGSGFESAEPPVGPRRESSERREHDPPHNEEDHTARTINSAPPRHARHWSCTTVTLASGRGREQAHSTGVRALSHSLTLSRLLSPTVALTPLLPHCIARPTRTATAEQQRTDSESAGARRSLLPQPRCLA